MIVGVNQLQPVSYVIPADRIVAGTYSLATAATRGSTILYDAPIEQMSALLRVLTEMGGAAEPDRAWLEAGTGH